MYKTKTISYDARVRTFWTLATICTLALVVYMYSVNMTIRNTVAREDLEGEVARLAAESSALEFEYIAKRHEIDMELASTFGLHEVKNPVYVSRTQSNSLTLNTVSR